MSKVRAFRTSILGYNGNQIFDLDSLCKTYRKTITSPPAQQEAETDPTSLDDEPQGLQLTFNFRMNPKRVTILYANCNTPYIIKTDNFARSTNTLDKSAGILYSILGYFVREQLRSAIK